MQENVAAKQSSHKELIATLLTPKEVKQIEIQRAVQGGKYEVHLDQGQPTAIVALRDFIKL